MENKFFFRDIEAATRLTITQKLDAAGHKNILETLRRGLDFFYKVLDNVDDFSCFLDLLPMLSERDNAFFDTVCDSAADLSISLPIADSNFANLSVFQEKVCSDIVGLFVDVSEIILYDERACDMSDISDCLLVAVCLEGVCLLLDDDGMKDKIGMYYRAALSLGDSGAGALFDRFSKLGRYSKAVRARFASLFMIEG